MKTINIAIADDQVLFRKGMISLLAMQEDFKVVLEAGNGRELIQRIGGVGADVVLMDLEMPEMNGIDATKHLRDEFPGIRVVMLSAHDDQGMILHAIESGAKGYLLKDTDPDEVIEALQTVMENGFCFNNDVSRLLLKGLVDKGNLKASFSPAVTLSEREMDVLRLLCQELTNIEIGDKLCLSPRTIEGYRKSMIEKIGARNTVGLVMYAFKNNLLA